MTQRRESRADNADPSPPDRYADAIVQALKTSRRQRRRDFLGGVVVGVMASIFVFSILSTALLY